MRFLSILSVILFASCFQQERNCQDFRTGTFKSQAIVGDKVLETTFIRTDNIEIDIFEGVADTSSVRWLNDCEYIVTKLNPKTKADQKAVHIKILTTQENSYIFEYNLVGGSQKERSTAVRIE